jgi:DNA-binding NtrC family response regulator
MDLTFVPFAEGVLATSLCNLLSSLGHSIRTVAPQRWLQSLPPHPRGPTVLYLAELQYPRERLLQTLAAPDSPPSLAVVDTRHDAWDRELLGRCHEFVSWPCPGDELALRLERIARLQPGTAVTVNDQLLADEFARLNLIGRSPAFVRALATIKKIAHSDVSVLIQGETGTGKELAARAIHYLSTRRDHPFIPVNCGAMPDNLIESELFGHLKGAFTDAKQTQPGVVAVAQGGTLFLDEIETLSPKAQVVLLRFLQDQRYRPVGGSVMHTANVRILAAGNTDVRDLVSQGLFRRDLYFRLNIAALRLPPLRERPGDALLLAEYFMQRYRTIYDRADKNLSPRCVRWLTRCSWPGNVRELENLIHSQFVLGDGELVDLSSTDQPPQERRMSVADRRSPAAAGATFQQAKAVVIDEFERRYLELLLAETGGNVSAAARRAGKERRALGKLIKKHRLKSSDRE